MGAIWSSGFFVHPRHLITVPPWGDGVVDLAKIVVAVDGATATPLAVHSVDPSHSGPTAFGYIALIELRADVGVAIDFDYAPVSPYTRCTALGFPIDAQTPRAMPFQVAGREDAPSGLLGEYRLVFREGFVPAGAIGSACYKDENGRVVGVLMSSVGASGRTESFAIPSDFVVRAFPQLASWHPPMRELSVPEVSVHDDERTFGSGGREIHAYSLESLTLGLQELSEEKLQRLRVDLDEGLYAQTRRALDKELSDERFNVLPNSVRAGYLRVRANIALLDDDFILANALSAKAKELDNGIEQRLLEAKIALAMHGPDAALSALPDESSLNAVLLRATLLHMVGRSQEMAQILDAVSDFHPANAEVHRLLAIARLTLRQREAALQEAERAYALAPKHVRVIATLAVANYYFSTPPALIGPDVSDPPEPPPFELLSIDHDALIKLRRAYELFTSILVSLDLESWLISSIELWRLACVAPDVDRIEEAVELATSLLYRTLPNNDAIRWVLTYDLPVDLTAWLSDAQSRLSDNTITSSQRRALAWYKTWQGLGEDAIAILRGVPAQETQLDRLKRKVALALALVEAKDYSGALTVIEDEDSGNIKALRDRINEARAAAGTSSRVSTSDALQLLHDARSAAQRGDWDFIEKSQKRLLQDIRCQVSIRLVLYALINKRRYANFIELYEKNADWTRLAKHTGTRRAYIISLWNAKRRGDAIRAALELIDDDPTAESIDLACNILFEVGDFEQIAVLSRIVRTTADLTPEIALRFAARLADSSPSDAGALWDRAIELGIPDDLVTLALSTAYRVGRDTKTKELVHQMQRLALAGHDSVSAKSFDDVAELVSNIAYRNKVANDQYRSGTLPIHVIADALNFPIFTSHHTYPQQNQSRSPKYWAPVYVRHGSRAPEPQSFFDAATIALDVTTIVQAQYLGVMEQLLDARDQYIVDDKLIELFFAMREEIGSAQPAHMDHMRVLLKTIQRGGIDVIESDDGARWAKNNGGNYVTTLPPLDPRLGPVEPSPILSDVALNIRKLVEDLYMDSLLSEGDKLRALARMGTVGEQEAAGVSIHPDRPLLIDAAYLEMLHETDLIGVLLNAGYDLRISSRDYAFLERQVEEADQKDERLEDLDKLVNLVRDASARGKFAEISWHGDHHDTERMNTRSISAVLEFVDGTGAVVVDDRFANRFSTTGNRASVISLFDIMLALNEREKLADEDYFSFLVRARRAGLFFLPVSSREILHHVRLSSIQDKRLVETADLRTLRRYVGASFQQPGLHVVALSDDERAYIRFIDQSMREAAQSFVGNSEAAVRQSYIVTELGGATISAVAQGLDAADIGPALESLALLARHLLN